MPLRPPSELFDPPFEVNRPRTQTAAVVFNSPHSGRQYPAQFLNQSRLDAHTLRRSEDCYVDDLFSGVVSLGAPMVKAHIPRAYLDLNREPYELDPAMFADRLPNYVNTSSVRVAGGLGTIPRLVCETAEIYRRPLLFKEAEARIQSLYFPYHKLLAEVLDETFAAFGHVVLIDCHSMPSTAAPAAASDPVPRPDFVLGDRYGSTCAPAVTDFLETALTRRGYSAVRNRPYAGGHITQIHGRPAQGRHALQIEINRALYMDEETLTVHGGFYRLIEDFEEIIPALIESLPTLLDPPRMAAE
ncbi:N-formylglutamate amidohydrolase [Rhodoligotrophos defluvii]|uniref:N-formylglutamate amidohydrolase n=1 Tax=Rhodoligotrophos defluvii TaxID=2561934 RepID=UPI0010C9D23F|nr:N-formylglutamate amidohydrolase [Rhodoligotrophos defluvii]